MDDFAIKVENVSKTFKLPHEKHNSIKSMVVNSVRTHKKGYEVQHALKDVSFEVKQGEFFGIVGRNGGGKSTLLKAIAGIYTPTQGTIDIKGSLTPFIELGVGFSPELTGRENVYLNGALLGFSRKQMQSMYKDIVNFAELSKFMDQKLKNYSSGMQVRLAFSIAIRARSDILLLDEVLAVGDGAFQQKCFNYFEDLKLQKKTVVFVSHDMGSIRRFCTRAIYINNGELVQEGSPFEIADTYIADNMENEKEVPPENGPKVSEKHKLSLKISKQADKRVALGFNYSSSDKSQCYIGISVLRDGMSVAEITTPLDMKLQDTGKLTYELDISQLNGGIYQVSGVLCRQVTRELLAIAPNRAKFVVKGEDITKGGALRLEDTWKKL